MKQRSLCETIPNEAREELAEHPTLLQHLLYHRGIQNRTDAKYFLNPDYEHHLHDPFEMKDMKRAVGRTLEAIKKKEKIVIFSDYDADGIPGAVALHDFFKKIGVENFENYIPHRHDEGFGLNKKAIEEFGSKKTDLLITIDCGTADPEEVKLAQKLGMDVIILDHHEPNGHETEALAILNPKQKKCRYPFKELCGAGVTFKFIQGVLKTDNFGLKDGWEKWLLDMIGLATLSDMVSLIGENRAFAYFGLKVLRRSPRIGLMKLLRKIKINQRTLSEDDVTFSLTPKLNAASRMGHPIDAFRLLVTTDETEADRLSDHLLKINDERKGVVGSMVKEMKKTVSSRIGNSKVVVAGNPLWKPSLLGLAASSLVREFNRPVFLWGRDGDNCIKGSCRSDGSADVVKLMESAKEAFLEFGGHSMSGGFSVSQEKIHLLEEKLNEAFDKVGLMDFTTKFVIDKTISPDDINWNTFNLTEKLSPFGVGNPKPVFLLEKVIVENTKVFGKEKNHLELLIRKTDGSKLSVISFFSADNNFERTPVVGETVNLVVSLEKSLFRNFPELRLRLVDIF